MIRRSESVNLKVVFKVAVERRPTVKKPRGHPKKRWINGVKPVSGGRNNVYREEEEKVEYLEKQLIFIDRFIFYALGN